MNNKKMRFGFLVLAIYAALGVIGVSSRTQLSENSMVIVVTSKAAQAARATGEAGATEASVEWHSFLPGAFK